MLSKGRVLLIVHDNYQNDNTFPLWAGYLAAMLKRHGAEVLVYCQDIFHYTNDELADYLANNDFDLIGLGFMAARFKRSVKEICRVINHHKKNAWLVLGGHGPTPIPEYILNATKADVVVMGEAEDTIVELLYYKLNSPEKISDIKALAFRINGKTFVNERRKPVGKLDDLPFPEWRLFPMEKYTNCLQFPGMDSNDKAFSVITTRGCTGMCSFCHRMENGIRVRGLPKIIEEMMILRNNYGVNYFNFADELSIVSKRRTMKFTQMIENNGLDIKYRMDCRVSVFDEELAIALKDSGCFLLNIGFESSDQVVLDKMNKKVTVKQNIRAAEIANKYGIGLGLNFMWGLPGDNEETLRKNAEFIKKYNQYDQIRTIKPVTPYPGSPLYYEAIYKGLLNGPEDFFNKFKNADLYMVNFIDIPEDDIYHMLFAINKDLILDHYKHTSGNMEEAGSLIERFYNLYFKGDYGFSGPRHYKRDVKSEEK